MNNRISALIALALAFGGSQFMAEPVFAWGDEGHKIVATIAYGLLTPSAKSQVDALLADDPTPRACGSGAFVDDAVWPDKLRAKPSQCASDVRDWTNTSPWHFLDIPVDADRYDHQRDCPNDDCVLAKITYFSGVLADNTQDAAHRRDALKFLIHFVGDLHQPLHTTSAPFDESRAEQAAQMGARRNTCLAQHLPMDRGGNCVDARDGRRKTELHAFWDTDVVQAISQDVDGAATTIMDGVTQGDIAAMQQGTVEDWTNEAHHIAVDVVYATLPGDPMPQLGGQYLDGAREPVKLQLRRAGARLAKLINDALSDGSAPTASNQ